jgi:hypothetical protein
MTIVGSTYFEFCMFPYWKELYGSGWRAACSLSEHTDDINFYTYLASRDNDLFKLNPVSQKIKSFSFQSIEQTLGFEYFHGLTQPKITPNPYSIQQNQIIEVSDDVILRYGFIEGDAKVNGKKVVYDP